MSADADVLAAFAEWRDALLAFDAATAQHASAGERVRDAESRMRFLARGPKQETKR